MGEERVIHLTNLKQAIPPCTTMPNLISVGQMIQACVFLWKNRVPHSHPAFQDYSRSQKLTWINRVPTVFNILLTFHSNYGPILYRFQDKVRYWVKTANVSEPMFV